MRKTRQMAPVGGAMRTLLSRLGLDGRLAQQRALVVWPEVVGDQIAGATRPLHVRDGILFVASKSSTWAHELIFRKAPILEALNKTLGRGTISDIRFLGYGYEQPAEDTGPDPGPPRPAAEEWQRIELAGEEAEEITRVAAPIGDPDLRVLVERVMGHGLRVRRWKEEHGWSRCGQCGLPYVGAGEVCGVCRRGQSSP